MSGDLVDVGRLLCVGVRGSQPGEPILERDLDACVASGVRAVILFDIDVPSFLRFREEGSPSEEARQLAKRNIESPEQLRALTDHLRERLGSDTLICVDQEGGATSRLCARRGFLPGASAIEFAAISTAERQAEAERQAKQLADVSIDLNFAPCVDLALEPASSIIAKRGRSFGASADVVVSCARDVISAHKLHGVGTCLKHFPGHGSATGDTHRGMVDVTETARPEIELEPYRRLLTDADPSVTVMVAHVMNRHEDPERPASLSPHCIDGLLRRDLGFDGLVVTDSLDMAAILDHWSVEQAAVMSIAAGADLALDGFNLDPRRTEHPAPRLAQALRGAVDAGVLAKSRIAQSIERIERFRAAVHRAGQAGAAR